jgi:hypothetical protein
MHTEVLMAKSTAGGSNNNGATKSDAIREALKLHPDYTAKEIVAFLADKGTKVAPTLVYYLRSKARQVARKQKRARVAAGAVKTAHANPVELVVRVKRLADEVGGIGNLKMLVDLLAE